MKRTGMIFALLGLILLSGCVVSLHPLYTEDTQTFDPMLLGSWQPEDDEVIWRFERDGEQAYRLHMTDEDGKTGEMHATLVKIGNAHFLDLYPTELSSDLNDFYKMSFVRGHLLMRVEMSENALKLALFNDSFLKDFLAKQPQAIDHALLEESKFFNSTFNRLVLTANTAELQDFCNQMLQTAGAFEEPGIMKKIQ